jgi:hypothetical protein
MTLCGNAALLLFYSLLLAYKYRNTENSLLISYEKRRKLTLLNLKLLLLWYYLLSNE